MPASRLPWPLPARRPKAARQGQRPTQKQRSPRAPRWHERWRWRQNLRPQAVLASCTQRKKSPPCRQTGAFAGKLYVTQKKQPSNPLAGPGIVGSAAWSSGSPARCSLRMRLIPPKGASAAGSLILCCAEAPAVWTSCAQDGRTQLGIPPEAGHGTVSGERAEGEPLLAGGNSLTLPRRPRRPNAPSLLSGGS